MIIQEHNDDEHFLADVRRCQIDPDYFRRRYCVLVDENGRVRKPRQSGFERSLMIEHQMHFVLSCLPRSLKPLDHPYLLPPHDPAQE